ncbi:hypothetical protein BP6252_11069 [Coleophoma cylindrospora]|uniref:Uncharacterized protein n=1 Tax=Coleophoma cylindrospora TaxID=1849047 RepID=A0A3D8QPY0_9HELO|nr:hypothetical protein BP6252_11069 [Coleophoma cylindrospora]
MELYSYDTSKDRVGPEDFNFIATIGRDNTANVMLAESKHSKKLYAIKVLKKRFLIENNEAKTAYTERHVFDLATRENHPFIVHLFGTFQSITRLYFVTEYVPGGDLMSHLQKHPFLPGQTQFYAAEVCLVLKFLHSKGILYRDLKLDNIILTLDGHIKTTNFGLCAEDIWYGTTTGTFCGNTEFMAPEILLDKRYTYAVDWWAFGILIYQMCFHQSPFHGEDEDEIYDAILACEPLYPINSSQSAVDICQKLLVREPEHRLGSGPTDAQEVMTHEYFNGTNWDDIYHKRVTAPYKPVISHREDTSNFDIESASIDSVPSPVPSYMLYGGETNVTQSEDVQHTEEDDSKTKKAFDAAKVTIKNEDRPCAKGDPYPAANRNEEHGGHRQLEHDSGISDILLVDGAGVSGQSVKQNADVTSTSYSEDLKNKRQTPSASEEMVVAN